MGLVSSTNYVSQIAIDFGIIYTFISGLNWKEQYQPENIYMMTYTIEHMILSNERITNFDPQYI